MNELQQAVAQLILKATQAAEAAGKFAVEQLPDVAQQYILYVAVISWFWAVLGFAIALIPIWVWKATKNWDFDSGFPARLFGTLLPLIFGGALIVFNLSKAIMATLAPKVLLIQWAAELVK